MPDNKIQFIGHSSLWVTLDDKHFMIDANFSERLLGIIKRHSPLGIDLNHLPEVEALLVTHAHYDHLDLFTYKYFPLDKPLILPPGVRPYVQRFLKNPIKELKIWDSCEISGIKITAVPTKHYGYRFSGLRYTNTNGYILEGQNMTIYCPGDTGYGLHFKEIGLKFKIDVACLPIGAYRPRWVMKYQHLSPAEALQAFKDLRARKMIPIHWGGFRLAFDKINEPLETLTTLLNKYDQKDQVTILHPGESLSLS